MSSVLVKRQLLVAVTALNIPLDKIPNKEKVDGICSASKIVRNRLLREHARVTETIEILRQNQQDDVLADIDEEPEYDDDEFVAVASDNSTARSEFLYVAELKTAEKLVIPLLLAYGMRFSDTLLPQLLKLLIALLQPIPRFSEGELVQRDALSHIKIRCGSDEFFAFLVQCAAPITEKRSAGKANKADIAMLELILTTISLLLDNPAPETENTIGAFCRNHGVELLLVMVNQNFSSREKNKAILDGNFDINEDGDAENSQIDQNTESQVESLNLINLQEEGSDDDGLIIEDGGISRAEQGFQYDSTMQIAESDAQILKWNTLILHTISHIFKGVDLNELSLIGFQTQNADGQNTKSLFSIPNNDKYMKDCKRETDNWRYIAKSKQGAFNSNGLIVRSDSNKPLQTVGSKTMGTISSIFGTKRKDPLDIMKDMDKRKKGRFVKGMYEDSTTRSNLPFPTKIILSQQTFSFLCFGFEPLSSMVAEQMMGVGNKIMMATKEHKDAVSGFKGSGEAIEITSPIDTSLYSELTEVIHYMMTCSSFLHYIRKSIFLMKEKDLSFDMPSFQQQWQSVSSIVTLEHLEMGFTVLRSFLQIRDLRRRLDIKCVTNFLSEILLLLNLLLGGEIIKDPSVEVAAHALASSILYKEENIKATFDLLKEYAQRNLAMEKAQAFSLFTYAVFQLMEKCSYKGTLLLPKKQPRKGRHEEAQDGIEDDDSDNSSITSETNRAMLESMADMIDDSEEVRNSRGDEEAEEVAEQETNDVGEVQTPQMGFIENDVDDPSAVFSPLPKNTEDAEEGQSRDASVAPPRSETSLSSSGQTVFSTISSEREVSLDSYVSRLVTPKNSTLLYATLRHWRLNDADVNLALTFLSTGS
ncbi:hypothetical protein AGDE_14847 [Angomonas deanei]|uniref:Uncharacterized protein n=1 Tax=Angomonas deanei TaxID=59799 RepID=A0A7G2CKI6_9TRYP|nr:hypothetical protein AGDE_14847 [Angomonas deanei]CAD2219434.1 hypothetical protein, conserved [Angomonas deanei]|eukprot:EPY20123.1 hypothetical protein AGDE_14847 [Angomonas deanei]